ncbi:MBL fold metallo-hydrolase [Sporolactobacillus shoreae]|uniref:MBL fold metallo-hydrolase n=1 Tax=Sporolactobacillus shoreae TaxID=1465501 RepID=A0A4Z0GML5_9BACL|nr:MBL fold metallo-hydrolase [Sporolactobacillus shoreae]TGA98302.1 MBL fold metallo-hydrolase [Sporolactobacillus shoreae]
MNLLIYSDENISIFRSSLQETASTVIKSQDSVIVVDPTWLPLEIEEIKEYVGSLLGRRKLYLLFTHSDSDHIVGYKAFPEAKVIASRAFAVSSVQKKKRIMEQISTFDSENYLTRPYEPSFPKVDYAIENEGDTLTLGDLQLIFYNAPGHNDDGMFTIIEPFGIMLSGDYFCSVEFPYIYYSGELYEETLAKLDQIMNLYDLQLLIPGHGDFTRDKWEMKKRKSDSVNYIKSMRQLIKEHNPDAIDRLIDGYKFPDFMKKMNKNNMLLLEKEMGL